MTWGSARTALITTRLLCDRFPGMVECLAHECFLWKRGGATQNPNIMLVILLEKQLRMLIDNDMGLRSHRLDYNSTAL